MPQVCCGRRNTEGTNSEASDGRSRTDPAGRRAVGGLRGFTRLDCGSERERIALGLVRSDAGPNRLANGDAD